MEFSRKWIKDNMKDEDYWVYYFTPKHKTVSKLLPFAFFFSFFYVISKYELNNELMIF